MYVVLVGPSGCRKNTAMEPAYEMLVQAGVKLSSDCITREALIEQMIQACSTYIGADSKMVDHSSLTIFAKEFAVFLGYQQRNLVMSLTDWYDCQDPWTYTTKHGGSSIIKGTWVNLIGGITPTLLHQTITEEASAGGLAARTVFIYANRKGKNIAYPFLHKLDTKKKDSLLSDLDLISTLGGEFKPTQSFLDKYGPWYEQLEFNPPFQDERLAGYVERRAKHLLKLCMIFSASSRNSMELAGSDFTRALNLLEDTEKRMPFALAGVGKSEVSSIIPAIVSIAEGMKGGTIRYNEIIKHLYHMADQEVIVRAIGTMEIMGICEFDREKKILTMKK